MLSNLRSEYFLSSFFFFISFLLFFAAKLIIRWKVKYQLLTRNHEEKKLASKREVASWEFRVFRFVVSFPRNERKLYLYRRNVKSIQSHRERECFSSVPRSPPPLPSQSNQKCFIVFIKWFKSIFVSFKRFEFYLLVNQDISAISFNWKLMLLDYNFLKYTNKCFVDIFLF